MVGCASHSVPNQSTLAKSCLQIRMASFFYLLLSLLLLLPLLILLKLKPTSSESKRGLPPGPWNLPIIGCIHHLVGRGLPHHALRGLSQRYGDLMFLQLGELQTVVVSSKEAAREVMKTHDRIFCTRPYNQAAEVITYNRKDIAYAPYGEYWREMRKICVLKLLSSNRVQSFRPIREKELEILIQQIRSLSSTRQPLNLGDRFLMLSNDVTLQAIMGSKTKVQDLYLREIKNCIELVGDFGIANLFPSSRLVRMFTGTIRRAEKSRRNLDKIFENIVREQRENEVNEEAENLLRVLLRLHDEGFENNILTIDGIKAVIMDVLTGGTETSASTLHWAMTELIKNPRVMKKAQAELRRQFQQGHDSITESDLDKLHFVQLIIKETLRLHPPVPLLLPRECLERCDILGYDIPKGTVVIINAWALGRDSKYWENAEEFEPERFLEANSNLQYNGGDFEFIPFGAGRRMCPGVPFASVFIELVLANLLYHFDWELPDGITPDKLDMTETFGVASRKKYPLSLRATPYK